jgi:hypothetical protein
VRWIFCRAKRPDKGFSKYIYLTNKQLVYQLITSPENGKLEGWLDTFYKQLENLRPERNSSAKLYLIVIAALLLTRLNLITGISAAGFSVSPVALQHVLLIGLALSQFNLSYTLAKYGYISSIFDRKFYSSPPYERALLLAKYPSAYDVSKYYLTQIGTLPHTASIRIPVQLIAALVFLVIGLSAYVAFSFWLFIDVAIDVWQSKTSLPVFWSRSTVVIAAAVTISTYLLPTTELLKRRYMHIGLVKMMNRTHKSDRARYRRYLGWIDSIWARQSSD